MDVTVQALLPVHCLAGTGGTQFYFCVPCKVARVKMSCPSFAPAHPLGQHVSPHACTFPKLDGGTSGESAAVMG